MSAMGGMFAFGGGPVDAGLLAALGSRLERLGPDGGREAIAGSVGMAYRAFHTNAESRLERQPLTGRSCLLTWDGRLDNREELIALLGDELRGDRTDVAIVQAAYVRWGTAAFGRIIGDFALALWDSCRRALFLARDCIGTRTLYYHVNGDRILWSTDLGPLLEVSGVSIEVNDEYVAGFLTRGPDVGLTPYVNVHAVKPAFFLRVDVDGLVSEHRFWALDPNKEIRYRTDAEYEEHFRHLFREAVRVRLRSDRPVFAELSGGLDSSSIVCMADAILEANEATAPAVETVSYVFDDAPASDERKWIEIVERHRGRVGHHLVDREYLYRRPASSFDHVRVPSLYLATATAVGAVHQLSDHRGARVLLSGDGGDELLRSTHDPSPELCDLLQQREFRRLHQRLLVWARIMKEPYLRILWRRVLVPGFPRRLQAQLGPRRGRAVPAWLNPDFARHFAFPARMLGPSDSVSYRTHTALENAANLASVVNRVSRGSRQELGRLRTTFPYLHRPLVEFLHSIPFSQKLRPGETRSILRRSLSQLVPSPVIARRGKGQPHEAILRTLRRDMDRICGLFQESRVEARGYATSVDVQRALNTIRIGHAPECGRLLCVIALEVWLRNLSLGGAAVPVSASPLLESMPPASRRCERGAASSYLVTGEG